MKLRRLTVGLICGIVGACLLYVFYPTLYYIIIIKPPFEKRVTEFVLACQNYQAVYVKPYVRGRLVVVDPSKWDIIDGFRFGLGDLIARKPEEVGTALCISESSMAVGYYTKHGTREAGTAYKRVVTMSIVDLTDKVKISESNLVGSDPPAEMTGSSDGYGDYPTDKVQGYIHYVESLPR